MNRCITDYDTPTIWMKIIDIKIKYYFGWNDKIDRVYVRNFYITQQK